MSKKIPNKLKNDLTGFEDVLDLVGDKRKLGGQREEKIGKEYDIQSYLEQEKKRLDKIYSFLKAVNDIFINYSQINPLIKKSQSEVEEKTKILVERLYMKNSTFLKNMEQIYDSFFPKN